MTRRSLSKLQRVRVFDRAGGLCHLCGQKIHVGQRWDVEHVKPLSMGGADDDTNMAPAHVECHAVKTAEETTQRAKADRARARHLGIRPAPQIQSRGFDKRPPQRRASSALAKPLPARRLSSNTESRT